MSGLILNSECYEFIRDKFSKIDVTPNHMVLPYFYFNSINNNDWFNVNEKIIKMGENFSNKNSIFAELVFHKSILTNDADIQKIVAMASKKYLKGYILWINDFNENLATKEELLGYYNLLLGLNPYKTKHIIIKHGGYFSLILSGLTGTIQSVSHGMEYGESRAVIPVGGGISRAKFYIPELHKRFNYKEITEIFKTLTGSITPQKDKFYLYFCNCLVCKDCFENGKGSQEYTETYIKEVERKGKNIRTQYSTANSKHKTIMHYLNNKYLEYNNINFKFNINKVFEQIQESKNKYKLLDLSHTKHLNIWETVLKEIISKN